MELFIYYGFACVCINSGISIYFVNALWDGVVCFSPAEQEEEVAETFKARGFIYSAILL